jgi:hypothetical protein
LNQVAVKLGTTTSFATVGDTPSSSYTVSRRKFPMVPGHQVQLQTPFQPLAWYYTLHNNAAVHFQPLHLSFIRLHL